MRSALKFSAIALASFIAACGGAIGGDGGGDDQPGDDSGDRRVPHDLDAYTHDGGGEPLPGDDAGGRHYDTAPPSDDAPPPPPPPSDTGAPPFDAGPPPDTARPDGCYTEVYSPTVSITDLVSSFSGGNWLDTSLQVTKRRYPTGNFILETEKGDPQLAGFKDSSSFDALMESLMTMCHEETHGYDYEHSSAGKHAYVMRTDLVISVPIGSTFPRSEVLTYITDDSTSLYDDTYLKGSMGTYDFADMNDELNAYTNGLACLTAVQEHEKGGISARDGAVAHILYLQLYLKRARTAHASVYSTLKADGDWQKYVKYAWARVFFWDGKAKAFPALTIGADRIWTHVKEAANLDEIRQFTGREPADVACHPEK